MSIIIRRPWTRQPRVPVGIDWGNPLAQGLVGYINPAAPSPSLTRVGSPDGSRTATARGIAHAGNGASMWTQPVPALGSAASIVYVGNLVGPAINSITIAFGTSGSGNQVLGFQSSSSSPNPPRALVRPSNGSSASSRGFVGLTGNSDSITDVEVIALTYNGTGAGFLVYRNGADASGTLTEATTGAFTDVDNFSLGGVNRGTDLFSASGNLCALALGWNRVLTPSEIAQISANPWQLFAPQTQRIWTPAAASTYTLGTPTYVPGSITSTGFLPRIPVTVA